MFLIVGIFFHDAAFLGLHASVSAPIVAYWIGLKCCLVVIYAIACRWILSRLINHRGSNNLRAMDRITNFYVLGVAAIYAGDLASGMLLWSRDSIGDHVLVDELLVMIWPLTMVAFAWWAYYPIDRFRKTHATETTASADVAPAIPRTPPTRVQYVVYQLRLQIAIILVPLLFLVAIQESFNFFREAYPNALPPVWDDVLHYASVIVVLMLAPVALRYIWDTAPLPAGPLRERLLLLCERHRVGVKQLLVWNTYGAMINGAVMGLIAPLRFILLTDSLIERLPPSQVEAVMAHELAHVKRQHMIWLFVTTFAVVSVMVLAFDQVAESILTLAPKNKLSTLNIALDLTGSIVIGAVWFMVFGWVSRQFERQADTFAVQHSAAEHAGGDPRQPVVITDNAVRTMINALENVAVLNHIAREKNEWRHGSIAWRTRYLEHLIGQRTHELAIDKTVRRIKIAAIAMLVMLIVLSELQSPQASPAVREIKPPTQSEPLGPVVDPGPSPIMKPAS